MSKGDLCNPPFLEAGYGLEPAAAGFEHGSENLQLGVEKSTSSGVSSVKEDEQFATVTSLLAKNLATDNNCSIDQEDLVGAVSGDPSVEEPCFGGGGPREMVSSMKSVYKRQCQVLTRCV